MYSPFPSLAIFDLLSALPTQLENILKHIQKSKIHAFENGQKKYKVYMICG